MTREVMEQALEALENHEGNYKLGRAGSERQEAAITAIKEALAQPVAPKCGAIIEVFGKDWRLDYMSLPVGKHKLYMQQYNYTAPPQPPLPVQEPVARVIDNGTPEGSTEWIPFTNRVEPLKTGDFLYTTPPQRQWVGLTEEEIMVIGDKVANEQLVGPVANFRVRLARAIEQTLKERNG